jgi:hypothetical protein
MRLAEQEGGKKLNASVFVEVVGQVFLYRHMA